MARRHSSATATSGSPAWATAGVVLDWAESGQAAALIHDYLGDLPDGQGSRAETSSVITFMTKFPRVGLKASNKKLVCRYGEEGELRANFNQSRQGWLQKNQEIFDVVWASPEHAMRVTGEQEISPYFALRADNGNYWRVTKPQGILMATRSEQAATSTSSAARTDKDISYVLSNGGANETNIDRQTSPRRPDDELFTIEVHHSNFFTIRSKVTGSYVELREDGLLWCDQSSALQVAIKESQLFQLAVKVTLKTSQGLFVSLQPNSALMPCQATPGRKETFVIQLGAQNMCTISTIKKRLWRTHKKGGVTADGKVLGEPSKDELYILEQSSNGLGWTILSASTQLFVRAEGNRRLICDVERSPSGVPPDPNCYFKLEDPDKQQAVEDASDRRMSTAESGGTKRLRRILEMFELRASELNLEDLHDPNPPLLEGERIALIKHHMLSFHRCEAVLGTIVITNYRLAFFPDDPSAVNKGAEAFSFSLANVSKTTKLGSLATEAGNYRCLHITLKDFRTFYFSSIPFTIVRKPKMDTFYQVLEDHVEPRCLSDFFAFAHKDALATETDSCPKLHTDQRDFTRAINKAIGDVTLASWRSDSPLGRRAVLGSQTRPGLPRLGYARQDHSRKILTSSSSTDDENRNDDVNLEIDESPPCEGDGLGQLKNELFGMSSQSPNTAPLFAKEIEDRWESKELSHMPTEKKEDELLKLPFLTEHAIPEDGWDLYSPMDDFARLALDVSPWRVSPINWDFALCESYPRLLVVPAAISDEEIRQVKQFRSKGRIPVPTWRHKESGSVIVRCSQPKTGLLSDRSEQDEKLVSSIRQACGPDCIVYLIDARPRVNAVMNTITGAGTENVAVYNIAIDNRLFLGIPNIHVVRESGSRLSKVIDAWNLTVPLSLTKKEEEDACMYLEELRLLDKVLDTGWLDHITALLSGAAGISKLILDSSNTGIPVAIIVHCSDGWDRTPQLVALAQLLLDPFYRTIHGFEILIEKEFVGFGHRFHDRCGHQGKKDKDQRSPIFHQFLECAWQLLQQFPSAFEFNELFLETLLEHTYSCRFGTFLLNSPKERFSNNLPETTCSIWTFINGFLKESPDGNDDWDSIIRRRRKYVNPRYIHGRHHHLVPVINLGQREPHVTITRATSKPPVREPNDQARRNSDPGDSHKEAYAIAQRRDSEGPRVNAATTSPTARNPRPSSTKICMNSDPLRADEEDDDEQDENGGELDTPNTSQEEYEFLMLDATGSSNQGYKETAPGRVMMGLGYGRETVEDMLEYFGNKWRRAGISLYHAPIDRALGAGPDAGSIRFWASLYLRWRSGDILFPVPVPAIFISPASLPPSPIIPDAPATAIAALASVAAGTALSAATTSSRKESARLRRSTFSAPTINRPPSPALPDSTLSHRSSVHGGSGVSSFSKSHTIPSSARVQLGEMKRLATKPKADASLYTLHRASRAD